MLKNYLQTFICLLFFFSQQSIAADIRYNVGASVAHYDNINHDVTPVSDESSFSIYGGVELTEENASFSSTLVSQVRATQYSNNIESDENNIKLSTDNLWRINPGQLEWYVGDTFTQTAIDSLVSDTPSNRQDVNLFSTGPNYIIRINSTNNLRLEGRVENFTYEENDDSNRLFLAARWIYELNSATRLTANDEAITAKFNGDSTDYNRNDIYLGIDYVRGLNTFNAEYGVARIDNDDAPNFDGNRYLIAFTNTRTKTSSVRFIFENTLTDTGSRLLSDINNNFISTSNNGTSANDIFAEKSYRARYMKTFSNSFLALEIGSADRNYEIQTTLDEREKVADIEYELNLKRTNKMIFDLKYVNTTYKDPVFNRVDKDYIYSIKYLHEFMRNINFNVEVISNERISTIDTEAYEDLRFILSLNYTTL